MSDHYPVDQVQTQLCRLLQDDIIASVDKLMKKLSVARDYTAGKESRLSTKNKAKLSSLERQLKKVQACAGKKKTLSSTQKMFDESAEHDEIIDWNKVSVPSQVQIAKASADVNGCFGYIDQYAYKFLLQGMDMLAARLHLKGSAAQIFEVVTDYFKDVFGFEKPSSVFPSEKIKQFHAQSLHGVICGKEFKGTLAAFTMTPLFAKQIRHYATYGYYRTEGLGSYRSMLQCIKDTEDYEDGFFVDKMMVEQELKTKQEELDAEMAKLRDLESEIRMNAEAMDDLNQKIQEEESDNDSVVTS